MYSGSSISHGIEDTHLEEASNSALCSSSSSTSLAFTKAASKTLFREISICSAAALGSEIIILRMSPL